MSQYIVQGIFVVAGIISLLAAVFDWEWFFTARNTQFCRKECRKKTCPVILWRTGNHSYRDVCILLPEYTGGLTLLLPSPTECLI